MKKIFLSVCFIFLLFFSCTNVSEEDLIDAVEPPILVTYNADVKSIIDNNCLNCHTDPPQNGAPIPLTTFNEVSNAILNSNLIGRISAQAGEAGAMPFGGPRLPQNLIDLVVQWEADGLLEQE